MMHEAGFSPRKWNKPARRRVWWGEPRPRAPLQVHRPPAGAYVFDRRVGGLMTQANAAALQARRIANYQAAQRGAP
jgi:hypothetical protein